MTWENFEIKMIKSMFKATFRRHGYIPTEEN